MLRANWGVQVRAVRNGQVDEADRGGGAHDSEDGWMNGHQCNALYETGESLRVRGERRLVVAISESYRLPM